MKDKMKLNYKQKAFVWGLGWVIVLINWVGFAKLIASDLGLLVPYVVSSGGGYLLILLTTEVKGRKLEK